ncbi:MAG TPA: hypothetical protein PK867_14775, partial [Pirellulales bacterium]|nr:hypothetical protein [Pirellulales bacterium]
LMPDDGGPALASSLVPPYTPPLRGGEYGSCSPKTAWDRRRPAVIIPTVETVLSSQAGGAA